MRVELVSFVQKELRQTVRDRRVMFMLVAAPLIQTVVFGFAVNFDVDRIPTVVVDLDGSAESHYFVRNQCIVNRLSEKVAYSFLHQWNARRSADHDHFIDLRSSQIRILHRLATAVDSAVD